jgi:hypothetical protein
MSYREETGIDPRWIRKGKACNIGRGFYRIPGGTGEVPERLEMPKWIPPLRSAKSAKREKVASDVRSVIPSPFDDGAYDEPETDTENVAPVKAKRGRKPKSGGEDDPQAVQNHPEYDPSIGERAAPVFIHAWICDARASAHCPGRKPGNFYAENGAPPKCECGSTMSRHSWAPGKKLF